MTESKTICVSELITKLQTLDPKQEVDLDQKIRSLVGSSIQPEPKCPGPILNNPYYGMKNPYNRFNNRCCSRE